MFPPPQLEKSWQEALKEEWQKPYMGSLVSFLAQERNSGAIYPEKKDVFNAFAKTPFDKVNVVIIGQDPYHGEGQAHGLSFSVRHGVKFPPSLKNIFKELHDDLGIAEPIHGNLEHWAAQGVLMLNAVLTVRANQPRSHHGQGWEIFTDSIVSTLAARKDPVIFVLWGRDAQEKCKIIGDKDKTHHFFLETSHPSPYSVHSGFFGSRHFSKINDLLKKQGKPPIDWVIK